MVLEMHFISDIMKHLKTSYFLYVSIWWNGHEPYLCWMKNGQSKDDYYLVSFCLVEYTLSEQYLLSFRLLMFLIDF